MQPRKLKTSTKLLATLTACALSLLAFVGPSTATPDDGIVKVQERLRSG